MIGIYAIGRKFNAKEMHRMFFEQKHSSDKEFLMSASSGHAENFSFPLHLHRNCEFIYVEDGVLRVGINGFDFDVKRGEGAFILPNQPHEFSTPEHSKCWLVIFSADHIPALKEFVLAKAYFSPVIKPNFPDLQGTLRQSKSNPFRIRSVLYELAALYYEGEAMPQLAIQDDALVCRVVEYINAHYTESLTLQTMSKDLGYSYRYMSGVVNKLFKLTLPQVVSKYRINYACELLAETQEVITEIALRCGFGSVRNFNRSFKTVMGISPKEYRNAKLS